MSETEKKEEHPFVHFKEVMDSIVKEETKGAQLLPVDVEQRINESSYKELLREHIEKKDKFEDRKGPLLSLGEGWRMLFSQ